MVSEKHAVEHILIVDDDVRVRQMLARYFDDEGYRVTAVADGAALRRHLSGDVPSIVLLDITLRQGDNGLDLAREIRGRSDIPIIMLTGRGDVMDRVVGLEIGADDYIAKPFHLREVLARVRTVLRRRVANMGQADEERGSVMRFDDFTLDLHRRQVISGTKGEITLTTAEFDILAVFARHPGRVLTRDVLLNLTRGRNWEAYDRTVDAQISRLRKKIEPNPKRPALIKSVRGVGYVFTGKFVA